MKEWLRHLGHGLWFGFMFILGWTIILSPSVPTAAAGLIGGAILGFGPDLLKPPSVQGRSRGWRFLLFLTRLAGTLLVALPISLVFRGTFRGGAFTGTRVGLAVIGMIAGIVAVELLMKRLRRRREQNN